ncbi:threonine-rich protein-like [Mya arenaria]|uniref:threonine-rich protein-like n=1 Tax=Mya arenaria TaxID=6604 RepID=UPI0022E4BFAE|nr:threonine-rich protein-like [Mya arenaria]
MMTSKHFLMCVILEVGFFFQVECVPMECYKCQSVEDQTLCNTVIQCQTGQSCYVKTIQSSPTVLFEMGCENNQRCSTGSPASSIVGKRQTAASYSCHECCSASDLCNDGLCAHRKRACVDSETIDCALMHSVFNVCADIDHAKTFCPKFCGLCEHGQTTTTPTSTKPTPTTPTPTTPTPTTPTPTTSNPTAPTPTTPTITSVPLRVIVCENNNGQLHCPADKKIQIIYVNYGRTQDASVCPYFDPLATINHNCSDKGAFDIINGACNDRQQCSLSTFWFGDPCPHTYKYLEVEFICVGP